MLYWSNKLAVLIKIVSFLVLSDEYYFYNAGYSQLLVTSGGVLNVYAKTTYKQ